MGDSSILFFGFRGYEIDPSIISLSHNHHIGNVLVKESVKDVDLCCSCILLNSKKSSILLHAPQDSGEMIDQEEGLVSNFWTW